MLSKIKAIYCHGFSPRPQSAAGLNFGIKHKHSAAGEQAVVPLAVVA